MKSCLGRCSTIPVPFRIISAFATTILEVCGVGKAIDVYDTKSYLIPDQMYKETQGDDIGIYGDSRHSTGPRERQARGHEIEFTHLKTKQGTKQISFVMFVHKMFLPALHVSRAMTDESEVVVCPGFFHHPATRVPIRGLSVPFRSFLAQVELWPAWQLHPIRASTNGCIVRRRRGLHKRDGCDSPISSDPLGSQLVYTYKHTQTSLSFSSCYAACETRRIDKILIKSCAHPTSLQSRIQSANIPFRSVMDHQLERPLFIGVSIHLFQR